MAHYLVTGGCGFIGSHLCEGLVKAGHRVRVVDNLFSGAKENLPEGVELLIGDIRDEALMQKAVNGVDGCFHLAAIASVPLSQERWHETHSVNLGGTITLFEAIRKQAQLISKPCVPVIYASSAAVYGDNSQMPLSEESTAQPITAYGADKLGCEQHALVGYRSHGIPSIGFRFFNVYGPRQNPDSPYSGVISIFIRHHLESKPITIFGDGKQLRDFVYVGDAVTAMITGMQKMTSQTCQVMNVCTGQGTTILELADIITKATKHAIAQHMQPARTGDIRLSVGSNARLKNLLGIVPATSLALGISITLEF